MTFNPYFTSDPHAFHNNVIKYCNRPFVDIDDMHAQFIERWNKVITPETQVFWLGDIAFSNSEKACQFIDQLQGIKHLVAGNHDHALRKKEDFCNRFVWVKDYHELTVQDKDHPDGKQHIVMTHYPFLSWNRSRHGSWHLHGHTHGTLDNQSRWIRRYDVGVDANNFEPVSYERLKAYFADKRAADIDPYYDTPRIRENEELRQVVDHILEREIYNFTAISKDRIIPMLKEALEKAE